MVLLGWETVFPGSIRFVLGSTRDVGDTATLDIMSNFVLAFGTSFYAHVALLHLLWLIDEI